MSKQLRASASNPSTIVSPSSSLSYALGSVGNHRSFSSKYSVGANCSASARARSSSTVDTFSSSPVSNAEQPASEAVPAPAIDARYVRRSMDVRFATGILSLTFPG
ncbi:MAG: hypothetical protein ACOCRA_00810, partial [Halobacteria archaeon]